MDKKKKDEEWRRNFEDFLGSEDMDEIMEAMREQMNKMMEDLMNGDLDVEKLKPYMASFSMKMDADGNPHIERFGNTDRHTSSKIVPDDDNDPESREPLTDMIEADDHIGITIEVPGVEKEDVDLEVVDQTLVISIDTEVRRYFKEIELPCPVDPRSAKATYNNGVLDIILKRTKSEKKGTKIEVE